MESKVAIIGGGVAGLTAAIGLHKLGIRAQVFERVQLLRGIGAGFGLAANAMQAFDYLGLREGVEQIGHFLPSYNILDQDGRVLVTPSTGDITQNYHQKNFSIHRGDLHQFLLAQLPADTLNLGKEATHVRKKDRTVVINFTDGSSVEADALIVADGVKSPIRQQMIPSSKPRYSGYTCWRAVIDNSSVNIKRGSETWGAKGRFGMTPLVNNKLYWYACINAAPNSNTYRNYRVADLQKHFSTYHSDVSEILAHTSDEDLLWNDIIDIKPLDNLADGRILYIGDAGHATTPNLGQGACQAIEDVAVLVDELRHKPDFVDAFKNFNRRRLQRTRYITNTSWQIGKIAQWDNPLFITIRNTAMRMLPEKIKQIQLQKLLKEDFMSINKK
ncbi:FAD-dependent monooxygenase [Sphingobacterium deserti]|uniref:FAD dependent oxidoreductase n=1 Tax=Sphingobacterium deserti TaxID=1229276 RepID=A0A0B8T6S8_9SPHI|nr:FAD-dependent monooxygenase [Sphingobacterium deserti]KGE13879.1 FAD dependent oxidoreductase [Sphingobacterium deserti]